MITMLPATEDDARELAPLLRAEDRAEIAALSGRDPAGLLVDSVAGLVGDHHLPGRRRADLHRRRGAAQPDRFDGRPLADGDRPRAQASPGLHAA